MTVWKKLRNGAIAQLLIPASAKRTATPIGRKCRAQYAYVIAMFDAAGNTISESCGQHDPLFMYRVGENVHPDKFDDDIRVECTNGIHFFQTREEAESY